MLVLRILKAEVSGDPMDAEVWDPAVMSKVSRELFEAALLYLAEFTVDTPAFLHKLENIQELKLKDTAMTVAQQLRQEGHQEGRQEGRQEGVLAGKVQLCQQILGQPETPIEDLVAIPLPELQALHQRLQTEITQRLKD